MYKYIHMNTRIYTTYIYICMNIYTYIPYMYMSLSLSLDTKMIQRCISCFDAIARLEVCTTILENSDASRGAVQHVYV